MTSLSVVSLMAMVPDSECRMPTLIVSSARAGPVTARPRDAPSATPLAPANKRRRVRARLTIDRFESSPELDMSDPLWILARVACGRAPAVGIASHVPSYGSAKAMIFLPELFPRRGGLFFWQVCRLFYGQLCTVVNLRGRGNAATVRCLLRSLR